MNTYPSLEAFYSANEARRRSGEAAYGVWWMDTVPFPKWRVSYVHATGEVYAVQLTSPGIVEVLGVVTPDCIPESRPGEGTYYRTLDKILEGWPDNCGRPGGLAWVRGKLAAFRQQPETP